MYEDPLVTAARKIHQLEREIERMKRIQVGYTLADVYGTIMQLPELRAYYPFSSVDQASRCVDVSGQGRTLTIAGIAPRALSSNFVPYTALNGATQYWTRADFGVNTFTAGGWFYAADLTGYHSLITKTTFGVAPWANDAYSLYKNNATHEIIVSIAGETLSEGIAAGPVEVGKWYFAAIRFQSATSLTAYLNGRAYQQASAITTLNTPSTPFNIGSYNNTTSNGFQLNGRATMCFLCAAALPDALLNNIYQISRGFFDA